MPWVCNGELFQVFLVLTHCNCAAKVCSLPLCCHSLGAPVRTRRRPLKGKFVLFHMRVRPACYHFLGPSSHGKEKLWICKNTHSVFCNTSCHRCTEFSFASSDTKCAWFGPNLHYYDFRHQNLDKTASTVLESCEMYVFQVYTQDVGRHPIVS